MSGETEKQVSGWTVDTLKELHDRDFAHMRELRQADQKALDLALQNNKERLDHLNENAKRTIEERSHFLSVEAYEPFRDMVVKFMATQTGVTQGSEITIGKIYAAIGASVAVIGILVVLANAIFK